MRFSYGIVFGILLHFNTYGILLHFGHEKWEYLVYFRRKYGENAKGQRTTLAKGIYDEHYNNIN